MITSNEAVLKLQEAQELGKEDPGMARSQANDILCELLESLDLDNVVKEYRKAQKWNW